MAALVRVGGLAARPFRQLAGQNGGGKKGKQCNPVLRIGNGELPDRRQEIIVERQSGKRREQYRVAKPPGSRDHEHGEQKG